jgi:hypothetical protein
MECSISIKMAQHLTFVGIIRPNTLLPLNAVQMYWSNLWFGQTYITSTSCIMVWYISIDRAKNDCDELWGCPTMPFSMMVSCVICTLTTVPSLYWTQPIHGEDRSHMRAQREAGRSPSVNRWRQRSRTVNDRYNDGVPQCCKWTGDNFEPRSNKISFVRQSTMLASWRCVP